MDYKNIKTNMQALDYVKEIHIVQGYNEHSKLYLTGILKSNYSDKYQEITSTKNIEIYIASDNNYCIFSGIVQECTLKQQGEIYSIEIKGISHSFLLDIKKSSRSFQNVNDTYRSIFKELVNKYKGKVIDNITEGKPIGGLLMQYEETDWQFLKRLASHFNSALLPDISFSVPNIIFGIREGYHAGALSSYEYSVRKDLNSFRKLTDNAAIDIREADMEEYIVWSYYDYTAGSQVMYKKKEFYIKQKEVQIDKGLLTFKYNLCTKRGIAQEKNWNSTIIGLVLKAKVTEVKNDKIRGILDIDRGGEGKGLWDFTYTTLYAPSGKGGWYCMPEVGDTVLIHFPTKDEAEAFAMNSLRTAGDGAGDGAGDTSVKYLRTADGKEIRFTSEGITIACSNYSNEKTGEKNIIYIDLKDSGGITITSTKPININTDSELKIDSKKKITISAEEQIAMKCKTSQIMLNEMVDISGKIVRIN